MLSNEDRIRISAWGHPPEPGYDLGTRYGEDDWVTDGVFEVEAASRELLGKSAGDICAAAIHSYRHSARWPTDFLTLRITHAYLVQNPTPAQLDERQLDELLNVLVALWARQSIWVEPPATDDWGDLPSYAITCDGSRWLHEQGYSDHYPFVAGFMTAIDETRLAELSFPELRVGLYLLQRRAHMGGADMLTEGEGAAWLSVNEALRRAWNREFAAEPMMENPWRQLTTEAPFVYPPDLDFIDAFNQECADKYKLDMSVTPSPVLGFRDSNLLVLQANPLMAAGTLEDFRDPEWREAIFENLHSDNGTPFLGLQDRWSNHQGGQWWRQCLSGLKRAGFTYEELAELVMAVDFHGYHSTNWTGLPITFPSQPYGFTLVNQAIDRGAVIVLMRAARFWKVAVPRLNAYPKTVQAKNPRRSTVSKGNFGAEAWQMILDALGNNRDSGDRSMVTNRFTWNPGDIVIRH